MTTNTTPATTAGTDIAAQKATVEAGFTALIKGLNNDLPTVDPFVLGGQTLLRATVLSSLQARIDAAEKTKAAKTAFHLAVEAEQGIVVSSNALRAQLKTWLQAYYGAKSTKLQEFGFTPRKRGKTTAATKAAGVQKAQATKAARGIVGKVQRKKIKAPATTTTATASATTVTTPAPAAAPAATPIAPKAPAGANGQ
jgi:hypothetical protein